MAFQYEYQFVEGMDPFSSFFDLISRMNTNISFYSILIILFVFLYYGLSKKSSLSKIFPAFLEKMEKKNLKKDSKAEYALFTGFERRGIQFNDVLNFGVTIAFATLGVLFITETIFFAVIPTESMVPTLNPTDLVFVESFSTHTIEVGDIVVFAPPTSGDRFVFDPRRPDEPVPNYVHRVISISDGKIQTAGDNGKIPDPFTITKENIVGKVAEISGRPAVFRGKGIYFMPGKVTLAFQGDPMFGGVTSGIGLIQENGPIYIFLLIMIAVLELGRSSSRSRA